MIPAVGLIVATYVILRCLEIITRPPNAFTTPSACHFMRVAAVLAIWITLGLAWVLFSSGLTGI